MKPRLLILATSSLLLALLTFLLLRPLNAAPPDGIINVGVGSVDITPAEPMPEKLEIKMRRLR